MFKVTDCCVGGTSTLSLVRCCRMCVFIACQDLSAQHCGMWCCNQLKTETVLSTSTCWFAPVSRYVYQDFYKY